MKLSRYEYSTEGEAALFKFTSEGPKGSIKKLVVYSQMLEPDIYNLAFGDYNEETEAIDDSIITNNNDSQKVLATVASTLYVFTDKHPNVWVYATGSNSARTRLYRMGITTNIEEVLEDFEVFGLSDDTWQEFEKGKEYEAFLVKRK
ncbi:MAG: hypothetical protein JWQ09_5005 [Segetibacter sp.]|nr:hypothetical protein [Segetibacter sp.]